MTKKDIIEWLSTLQGKKLESAELAHEKRKTEIREEIFVKYGLVEMGAELEKLMHLSSTKYQELLSKFKSEGLTHTYESIELGYVHNYSGENMLDYLFSCFHLRLDVSALSSENNRYEEEKIGIMQNYFAVGQLVNNSKNIKEALGKLEELSFDLADFKSFNEDSILRGTKAIDLDAILLVSQN